MKTKISSIVLILLALSACSTTHSRSSTFDRNEKAFLQAEAVPPTQIPSGLSNKRIDDLYAIPNVSGAVSGQPTLLPPGSLAAQQAGK